MGIKTRKVVIIGAGYVGSHVASSLMLRSVADEIVLIDIDEKKAYAHALDIYDAVSSIEENIVVRTGDYSDSCNGSGRST